MDTTYWILLFIVLITLWFVTELILFLSFKGEKKKAIKNSFIASAAVFGAMLAMILFIVILFMIAITNM